MRRLFWFLLGVVTGAFIVDWTKRTIESVSEKLTLANFADLLGAGVRRSIVGLFDGVMLLIDHYRNRGLSDPSPMSPQSPKES